jgi:hypothetical protein
MSPKEGAWAVGILFNVVAIMFVVALVTDFWIDHAGAHTGLFTLCYTGSASRFISPILVGPALQTLRETAGDPEDEFDPGAAGSSPTTDAIEHCTRLPDDDVDLNTWRAFACLACILCAIGSYYRFYAAIQLSRFLAKLSYFIFFIGCASL